MSERETELTTEAERLTLRLRELESRNNEEQEPAVTSGTGNRQVNQTENQTQVRLRARNQIFLRRGQRSTTGLSIFSPVQASMAGRMNSLHNSWLFS